MSEDCNSGAASLLLPSPSNSKVGLFHAVRSILSSVFESKNPSSHSRFVFQIVGEKRGSTHRGHSARKRVKMKDLDAVVHSVGNFVFQPNYVVFGFSKICILLF